MLKKLAFLILLSTTCCVNAVTQDVQQKSLLRRIYMLEWALAPASIDKVAPTWAEATKKRDGAVQYMLLCSALKTKAKPLLEGQAPDVNWVSGTSSPEVLSYTIKQLSSDKYAIQYQWSAGMPSTTDTLVITQQPDKNDSQKWCISRIEGNEFAQLIK